MNAINNDAAKPSDLPEKILHYINGEFVESIDGEEFDVVDPVTNQTYITAASPRRKLLTMARGPTHFRVSGLAC